MPTADVSTAASSGKPPPPSSLPIASTVYPPRDITSRPPFPATGNLFSMKPNTVGPPTATLTSPLQVPMPSASAAVPLCTPRQVSLLEKV